MENILSQSEQSEPISMINVYFTVASIIQKQISVKYSSSGNIAKDSLTPKQTLVKSEENSRVLKFDNPISFIDPSSGIKKTKKHYIFLPQTPKKKKIILQRFMSKYP